MKNNKVNKLSKDILKDINKKLENALNNSANEISFQTEMAFEHVIDRFYNHKAFKHIDPTSKRGFSRTNIPRRYNRTESTYYASNRFGNYSYRHMINKKNGLLYGGIRVSSEYILNYLGTNPYNADADWVFSRTYEQGIHGFTKEEERTKYVNVYNYKTKVPYGYTKLLDLTYPLQMKPSPEHIMNGKFRMIGSSRNVSGVLYNEFLKIF